MHTYNIILASSSPRRKELLKYLNINFKIVPAKGEEIKHGNAEETVQALALQKATEVANIYPDSFVIGADTVVSINNKILGKPKDKQEAHDMLSLLSGKMHSVLTGICIYSPITKEYLVKFDKTNVYFEDLSEDDILSYISTDEPYDKAGGYAIQGLAGAIISRVDGCVSNVIGLPLPLLKSMLLETHAIQAWLK